jgi:hypothetical protein
MTEKHVRRLLWIGALPVLAFSGLLAGCTAAKAAVYATPDYLTWKRTTDVVLDYPIPGHQDRFRIPRMNAVGFTVTPTVDGGKRHWDFPDGTVIIKVGNFCITCHSNANEKHPYGDGNANEEFRDYVYFVPGEGEPKPGAGS